MAPPPHVAALTLGWGAALLVTLGSAGCEDTRPPEGPLATVDAGESDVRVVRNPRTCEVSRVSAGARHTCAVLVDGRLYCWGANDKAQLGLGDLAPRALPTFVPTPALVLEPHAAEGSSCARLADTSVACWGETLGQPVDTPVVATPTRVPLPGSVANLALGGAHACAWLSNGTMWCWGEAGLVGDGTALARPTPVEVAGIPATTSVLVATRDHTCTRTPAGEVTCWGRNDTGALGVAPGPGVGLIPVRATAFTTPVVNLALAPGLTCTLGTGDLSGAVFCVPPLEGPEQSAWGRDNRVFAVGPGHACVIRSSGVLACSGKNDAGQLGPDPRLEVPAALPVEALPDALFVSVGEAHTCALRADRSLWCWGQNASGQLGVGTLASTNVPTPVAFPPGCPN
ncbi:MAG: hypothetical protein KA712_14770 [Myxococcales bacterium]|nr:hypothetical protein [Myxococcales bacterium]